MITGQISGGAGSARRACPAARSAARGRRHVPVRPEAAKRALDHALDRVRLGSDRPRAHGGPDHRHAELGPDERAEQPTAGTVPRTRCCGSRPGTALPRAQGHLAHRRADGRGDRHQQQPQPRSRAAEPRAGHDRVRRSARPGRAGRHRLGAQPVDQQRLVGLRLQRLAFRAAAAVDGRRHERDAVAAGGDITSTATSTRSRATRSSRRDQPSERPRPPGVVVDQRGRGPEPAQQPQPRPRHAGPAARARTR